MNAFILADIIDEVGLPAGVFNLVSGAGPVVGEALVAHPLVDMVSFTGSTRAGRRVSELASQSVKRVALELGGKSANVILDDADFERAVADGVGKCFLNSGQTCSALTRMLVPRDKLAQVEEIAARAAEAYTPGDPFADTSRFGPLVSAVQRDRVRGYIAKGIEEGARLVTGGAEPPEGLAKGYFVRPTVFSDVRTDMTIAQEEIFGPVLSILPYDTEEEAVAIANDTIYGLAGGVWSGDAERARRVARQMRTGQVEINGGSFNPLAPFGGFKQSGNGRELGKVRARGVSRGEEPPALVDARRRGVAGAGTRRAVAQPSPARRSWRASSSCLRTVLAAMPRASAASAGVRSKHQHITAQARRRGGRRRSACSRSIDPAVASSCVASAPIDSSSKPAVVTRPRRRSTRKATV